MKIIEKFLPENLIDGVLKINETLSESNFINSNDSWPKDLLRPGSTILTRPLSANLSLFLKDIFLQHGLLDEHFTGKFMAMAYIWKPHSYIPWHNDGIYSTGVTIYLNRNWNLDWGGLLIWKEKGTEKLQVSPPHFNIAVVNCNGIEHATTMVSPDAPLRQTIQCFW